MPRALHAGVPLFLVAAMTAGGADRLAGAPGTGPAVDEPLAAEFIPLGDLPGGAFLSVASAVSADGSVVVGTGRTAQGAEAFRWTEDTGMLGLGDLPGGTTSSTATSVSADGSVVVGYSGSAGASGDEAFRWTQGQMLGLGSLTGGAFRSQALAVSDDGNIIVGWSSSESAGIEAFRWQPAGGMKPLGFVGGSGPGAGGSFSTANAIDATGTRIVGRSDTAFGFVAFERTVFGMLALAQPLASEAEAQALDVTPDGSIAVGSVNLLSADGPSAIRWKDRFTPLALGDLPGGINSSVATSVSADGSVIVGSSNSDQGNEAFIWTEARGMESLRAVLEIEYAVNLTGWELQTATGISDDGLTIVGRARNPQLEIEAFLVRLNAPLQPPPPPLPPCAADWDGDGHLNDTDFFVFIRDFFGGIADFNDDGVTNDTDWFDFLNAFFQPELDCDPLAGPPA